MESSDKKENNYQANKGRYGDAVYEISTAGDGTTSWHDDYSNFPYSDTAFFKRGGGYNYVSHAGAFSFDNDFGNSNAGGSFRPVLATN